MLKIEFTSNMDADDAEGHAKATIAALVALYGPGIIPASYEQVGNVARATGPANITINAHTALAPDGYPSKPTDLEPVAPQADAIGEDAPILTGSHDTAGIPWDERIHASTKTTNKDGTWTRRRNTPDETFDAVMAELKGVKTNLYGNTDKGGVGPDGMVSIPAPPAPATIPGARDFTAPSARDQSAAEPSASEAFAAPPAPASVTIPAAPVPSAPPATGDAPSFVDLMKKITTLQGAGKLTKPDLDGYLQSCGVEGVGKLATASADARSNVGAILDGLV